MRGLNDEKGTEICDPRPEGLACALAKEKGGMRERAHSCIGYELLPMR